MKPGRDQFFKTLRVSDPICSSPSLPLFWLMALGPLVSPLRTLLSLKGCQEGKSDHLQMNKPSSRLVGGSLCQSKPRWFLVSVAGIFRSGLFLS